MIKLKDLLTEGGPRTWKGDGPAWEESTLENVMEYNIPLSVKFFKKLLGDIPISTFHMTDFKGLAKLKRLQGKKKSISTFNATTRDSDLSKGKGIQTEGGILLHLTGNLLAASISDMDSQPDESGRRWISSNKLHLLGTKGNIIKAFDKTKSKKYWDEFGEKHEGEFDEWMKNHPEFSWGDDDIPEDAPPNVDKGVMWRDAIRWYATKKEKNEFIKEYIDTVYKILLKHKKQIKKIWAKRIRSVKEYDEYNELVIYNIKIEDIVLTPKIWKKLSDSEKKTVETTGKGKVIYAKKVGKEISSFITSRGGKIK